jgi:phage terminase large subunit GpA-like protein
VWHKLDRFLKQSFRHENGAQMRIQSGLIDSGFATSQVYRYTRTRRHLRVYASKGVGGEGIKVLGKPTLQGKERVILYAIGVDEAKREFLRSQILEIEPGPGYVHLPDWLTSDQVAQLVAEKRVRRFHRGKVSYEWMKKMPDAPNEALDCRIYARAALEQLGPAAIAQLPGYVKHIAAQSARLSAPVEDPEAEDPLESAVERRRPARSRGGYVGRWRG